MREKGREEDKGRRRERERERITSDKARRLVGTTIRREKGGEENNNGD